ncbi:hypothetical protein BS47DRAFT_688794 [Hydnum rufescens UP504]|uniref:Uncharacterized protein n=1 Tax=Hydnum rufescens UP504 TaxID=1448309 RepID=A0A9P6DGV2_9AGAM|nr:hypothetical protein BS47DRAFT_688794 [Hydnum rufescens UP504]
MVSGNRTTPTVDARSFVAMAKAKPPLISWVREFYEKITSLKSPLRAFLSGDVRDIKCCKDSGGVGIVFMSLLSRQLNELPVPLSAHMCPHPEQGGADCLVADGEAV